MTVITGVLNSFNNLIASYPLAMLCAILLTTAWYKARSEEMSLLFLSELFYIFAASFIIFVIFNEALL